MTDAIESQIERFAPGFRDLVLARHVMSSEPLESYDANYVGGDINGGVPICASSWPPRRVAPAVAHAGDGLYLCSSSTPPSGGVHGMCGAQAARLALRHSLR